MLAGTVDLSRVKAFGCVEFNKGKDMAGVGTLAAVAFVRVNVMLLVLLKEVLGKFNGEALDGLSTTGPLLD
jgi:hypothetical protein